MLGRLLRGRVRRGRRDLVGTRSPNIESINDPVPVRSLATGPLRMCALGGERGLACREVSQWISVPTS